MTPNASSQEASTRIRWRVLALLMGLCFLSHLNRLAMSVAGTERIIPDLRITPERMGLVYTSFLACYTAGMIFGGWCIDRLGPRIMLLIMGCASAIFGAATGALGFGMAGSASFLTGLIVVRGAMGLFTTPLHPACARAIVGWIPSNQVSWANGLVTFAAVLGMASTWPVFGALMDRLGWPSAFCVVAGLLFAMALAWSAYGRDRIDFHPAPNTAERLLVRGPSRPRKSAGLSPTEPDPPLWSRNLLLLAGSYAAVGYFQYLFFYWSEFYFKEVMHLGTTASRNSTTLLVLALGLGMPVGGWCADRCQRRYHGRLGWILVPGTALLTSSVVLFLGILASAPAVIVGLFALAMFALGASESSFWQGAILLGGSRGGLAAAVVNTGGNGIGLLAPLLTPFVSARLGWHWGIAMGGVAGILGAACWMGIRFPSPDPETKSAF